MTRGYNWEENNDVAPYEPPPAVCCCESSGRPIPNATIINAGCKIHMPNMFAYVGKGAPSHRLEDEKRDAQVGTNQAN